MIKNAERLVPYLKFLKLALYEVKAKVNDLHLSFNIFV